MNNTDMKCRTCFFGSPTDGGERYLCHVNRPIRGGFPTIEPTDYCQYWTDEETRDHPLMFTAQDSTGTRDAPRTGGDRPRSDERSTGHLRRQRGEG